MLRENSKIYASHNFHFSQHRSAKKSDAGVEKEKLNNKQAVK